MSWSAPVTVVTGQIIAASWGNTYVRDNTRYLKGLDGAVTIDNGLSVVGALGAQSLNVDGAVLVVNPATDRVGINRTVPAAPLHVAGRVILASDLDADTGGLSIAQSGAEIALDTDGRTKAINMHAGSLVIRPGANTGVTFGNLIQIAGGGSAPTTGLGVELSGGAAPGIAAYNRAAGVYLTLILDALTLRFHVNGAHLAGVNGTGLYGDGSQLTNLSGPNIAGLVPIGALPTNVALAGEGVSQFANDSAYLTAASGLNATNLTAGTIPKARFPANFDWKILAIVNNASAQLLNTTEPYGLVVLVSDGPTFIRPSLYFLYGVTHVTSEVSDPDAGFSAVAGTAGTMNIYWNGTAYVAENKTGATRNLYAMLLNPVPA